MHEPRSFTGGFTATNGYTFEGREGLIVIDAPEGMADWLAQTGQRAAALFLTHWHFDHVIDAARLSREHECEVFAWGRSSPAVRFDFLMAMATGNQEGVEEYPVHHELAGRDSVSLAGTTFGLRHVPGHSPDSLVLISDEARLLFSGDTVMDGSIGRTDFPGGDFDLLISGIREKILTLPADYRIFPGHGSPSKIGEELRGNEWLQER